MIKKIRLCSIRKREYAKAKKSFIVNKVFFVNKKRTQTAVNAVFKLSKKPTLNTEIKNYLLLWYKVKCKWKTHFFKHSTT